MPADGLNADVLLALRRSTLFKGWSPSVVSDLAGRFRRLEVPAGLVCAREGEPGHELYVIDDGSFVVATTIGGQNFQLAELGPGAIFGELALLTGQPRSATVTAASDARIYALERGDFEALTQEHPDLLADLRQLAAERLRNPLRDLLANEKTTLTSLDGARSAVAIGRSADNDLVLDSPLVSRHHALIEERDGGYRIVDLKSTNGSFVNGQRVRSQLLADGDEIVIGSTKIFFDRQALIHYTRGSGVKIDVIDLSKTVGKDTTILNNVSLSIYPGELVCIVGVSGAGKTTLLGAVNGFRPATGGRVLYNGADYYQQFDAYRLSLGYVPQDDIVHPELTVEQTLYYAARLRLPADTSRAEIEALIAETLTTLGLGERRATRVQRLSGGERKRVSIGVELLSKPPIFFLDEPTSGLDPGLDGRMMQLLRRLADEGRTVILTTHATKNAMICDKVAFLARGGRLAFYGAPADALEYFGVADFTDIYARLEYEQTPVWWDQRFQQSKLYRRNVTQRLEQRAPARAGPPERAATRAAAGRSGVNPLLQLYWLARRYWQILLGDRVSLGILLAAAPLIALTTTQTFTRDAFALTVAEGGNAYEAIALLAMLSVTCIFLGSFIASRAIAEELPVYQRERLINLGLLPYTLSKVLSLGLFSIVQSALLTAIVSRFIELPGGERVLLTVFGILLLTNLAAVALGLCISAISNNGLQATLILMVIFIPQLLLAGGIQPLSRVTELARLLSHGLISRWSLSLLGQTVDLNTRIEAQLPKNDYFDQFAVDPARASLVLAGLALLFLAAAVAALKVKDVR